MARERTSGRTEVVIGVLVAASAIFVFAHVGMAWTTMAAIMFVTAIVALAMSAGE
jgi:hypothetical protein